MIKKVFALSAVLAILSLHIVSDFTIEAQDIPPEPLGIAKMM